MDGSESPEQRRALPPAHALIGSPPALALASLLPREAVRATVRRVLDALRAELHAGLHAADRDALTTRAHALLALEARRAAHPRLRPVVNATGVVLHTNLGRAPLGEEVIAHIARVARGYASLEYDVEHGKRGHRDRLVSELCASLLGAEDALVVNNNAAAVLLVATQLAQGREVVVSRGELVEIGGGFRVPDILAACGARLVEVGTTNRTRLADYARAIGPATAMLLKVHRSNFAMVGFASDVSVGELSALGREQGVPVVEDLGSGALIDTRTLGLAHEPMPAASIADGATLVMFSGDKLMGGPQAGIIAGPRARIDALRAHPLARAMRPGRLVFAALEATLRIYAEGRALDAIPTLAMLALPSEAQRARAETLRALTVALAPDAPVAVEPVQGRVGGGAMPLARPASWALVVRARDPGHAAAIERELRAGDEAPIVARIHDGAVVLDVRTVADDELAIAARGLARALARSQEIQAGAAPDAGDDDDDNDEAIPRDQGI